MTSALTGEMTGAAQLSSDMAGIADLMAALDDLRAGKPFATLLIDGAATRAAALESLLNQVTDEGTRVVWVGNPLRSPLTLERLFLQTGCAEADLRVERNPAELAGMLARTGGDAKRLLLIVQQPDTLDVDARETLGRMAPYLADRDPAVQVLFCGSCAFRVPEVGQRAAVPASVPAPWVPEPEPEPEPEPRRLLGGAVPLLSLLLLAGVGASISHIILTGSDPVRTPAVEVASPAPVQSASAAKLSAPAGPTDDVAALRREFDAFLAQRAPTVAALTDSQKDALFQEFLERHRQRDDPPSP